MAEATSETSSETAGDSAQTNELARLDDQIAATREEMAKLEKNLEVLTRRRRELGGDDETAEDQGATEVVRRSVLVVDDDPTSLRYLTKVVGRMGHRVVQAASGEEAWRLLQFESLDLVITDIMMNEISGIELVSRIRRDLRWASLPVIFCTSSKSRDDILTSKAQNANSYLLKPFDRDRIIEEINRALEASPEEEGEG